MPEVDLEDDLPWVVTWTARENMERSAHALVSDGRVWLVDPFDNASALHVAEQRGEVAAVLQLLDRHPRDCAKVAERYGVPHYRLPEQVPDSPFEAMRMVWLPGWREVALWWSEHEAYIVPEAVGTASYFAVGDGPVGVHPMLRPKPPATLGEFAPASLLVGHGRALHAGATQALGEALAQSRRELPAAALAAVKAVGPKEALDAFRGSQKK